MTATTCSSAVGVSDLLIGGSGADLLHGGSGDDLLIAGTTAFDANDVALAAIMAEWTSGRSYATRVANLSGTGSGPRANGNFFLKASGPDATVFDDNDIDVLIGGSGMDWFFADLSQDIVIGWPWGTRGPAVSQGPAKAKGRASHPGSEPPG